MRGRRSRRGDGGPSEQQALRELQALREPPQGQWEQEALQEPPELRAQQKYRISADYQAQAEGPQGLSFLP